jgi:hypothetical protein
LGSKIDGAGLAKLETLEHAVTLVQRVNTIVERMAQAQRMQQPLAQFRQQIQRAAAPLSSLLKSQFEAIADMVTTLVLVSTRGGTDANKVRSLRETVAQIRATGSGRIAGQEAACGRGRGPRSSDNVTRGKPESMLVRKAAKPLPHGRKDASEACPSGAAPVAFRGL